MPSVPQLIFDFPQGGPKPVAPGLSPEHELAAPGAATDVRLYDDQILAPISSPHPIPVPRAPAFGKLATTAQIGLSGIVEKLEYNKAAALSDLLNSGAQIYNQTQLQSSTAQAAAL